MSKRLFDHDPLTGTTEWFEGDGKGGFTIVSEQDAEPIIEANKRKQSMGREGYAKDPNFWHVASVPNIMLLKWAEEDGVPPNMVYSTEYADRIARKLNDPDYRHLKTGSIRV